MKFRRFLNSIPKVFRIGAFAIVVCAVIAGLVIRPWHQQRDAFQTVLMNGGLSLLTGGVVAIWLLVLGYVYADAQRRAMPPVPWTLVAFLVPNLLGFLLYFVMRRPLMVNCTSCGRGIGADQHFCSWCGHSQFRSPSPDTPSQPGSLASSM